MKAVGILSLAILFVAQGDLAYTQSGDWRVYSPPHSGFSVETPTSLLKVKSFDGEHGADFDPEQDGQWISSYASIETTRENSRFGIIVINGRLKVLRSKKREKYLESMSYLFFADDDETQFLRAPIAVKHNGIAGKEYLYIKESMHGSNLFTRGRIFDISNKIYVIVFRGQNVKDLTSLDAERFLNSFRLHRRIS